MIYRKIRRGIEVLFVLFVTPVALVSGLICAITIHLDSPGGTLFIQTRPGKNGHPFRMLKFRTMAKTANAPFQLTQSGDTRLTTVGQWMRAFHLDEIPQLWHVLNGEMSLIGPRPVPMELYDNFLNQIPQYDKRHTLAPGITGLAQVCLGYVNTLDGEREKLKYDLYYIENQNIVLDLWILWATFSKIVGLPVNRAKWVR